MKFILNIEKIAQELTFEELILLEEGRAKGTREVLARYLADENGKALAVETAREILNKLKLREALELNDRFKQALKEAAINPTIDGGQ
jgi:bacterioferritin (cytochrome b1)